MKRKTSLLSRALKGHSGDKRSVILQSSLGRSSSPSCRCNYTSSTTPTKASEAFSSLPLEAKIQISLLRQELVDGIERVEFLMRGVENNTRTLQKLCEKVLANSDTPKAGASTAATPTTAAATRFAPAAVMRDQISMRLREFYASLSNLPTRVSQLLHAIPPPAYGLAAAVLFAVYAVVQGEPWIREAWAERSPGWKAAASTVVEDCRAYAIEKLTPKADEVNAAVCSEGVTILSTPSVEVSSKDSLHECSTAVAPSSSLCEVQPSETACSDNCATATLEGAQEEVSSIASSTTEEIAEQALIVNKTTESTEQGN